MITREDLERDGWPGGPVREKALAQARELAAKGIEDKAYALKLLRRDLADDLAEAIEKSRRKAPLDEALDAETSDARKNLDRVREQLRPVLRLPVVQRAALMPDASPVDPKKPGVPVGSVLAVENAIVPAAHSSDICCSLFASCFRCEHEVSPLMEALLDNTRFGRSGRLPHEQKGHPVLDEDVWNNSFLRGLKKYAVMHLADQGDGNHFAFLGRCRFGMEGAEQLSRAGYENLVTSVGADDEFLVLVTHHGSRGLGARVFEKGLKAARKQRNRQGAGADIPDELAWLDADSAEGGAYWAALQYVSRWTRANHELIHQGFLETVGAQPLAQFGNEHNFVWKTGDTLFMHGKGATPAWRDETGRPFLGLIPLNMGDGILLTLGNGNDRYLSFSPHGAGRDLSRTQMRRQLLGRGAGARDAEEKAREILDQACPGADIRWYNGRPDLSELPPAYKSARTVIEQIQRFDLADVVARIQTLGCVMAGQSARKRDEEEELTAKQKRRQQHRKERRKRRQDLREFLDD